jgi:hypothetical protein
MLSFGNQGNVPGRPTVVITGGIHAREWIATEFAYLLAEYLIVNYQAAPSANHRVNMLRQLVNTRNIRIIPMVNPDGNRRTVFGTDANDRFWRKNRRRLPITGQGWIHTLAPGGVTTPPLANARYWTQPVSLWAQYRVPDYDPGNGIPPGAPNLQNHQLPNVEIGVDLNRNMASDAWGYDRPAPNSKLWDPHRDEFFGTSPGGEAETSNVQAAMAGAPGGNIAVSIDYHSYGRMILYPGEVAHAGPLAPVHQATGQMLNQLIRNQNVPYSRYTLGTPLAVVHYDAIGTVADYAAQRHQARSFTIELEGGPYGMPPTAEDPFVLPEADIQAVFEKNIRGALAAIAAPADATTAALNTFRFDWPTWGQGNQVP